MQTTASAPKRKKARARYFADCGPAERALWLSGEHVELKCAKAQQAAIDAALAPPGGWMRWSEVHRKPVLRRDAVIEALSVGCTPGQIAAAAGVTSERVWAAINYVRLYGPRAAR